MHTYSDINNPGTAAMWDIFASFKDSIIAAEKREIKRKEQDVTKSTWQ
jgi:hypothetical protein